MSGRRFASRGTRGVCESCGRETCAVRASRCRDCFNREHAERRRERARRGESPGPLVRLTLDLLASGPLRFTELRDALGITTSHAAVHLHELRARGYVVRLSRGLYARFDYDPRRTDP